MSEQELFCWLNRWTASILAGRAVFPGELTLNHLRVLAAVGQQSRETGCTTTAQLVIGTGCSRSTVGRALDAASAAGYVRWEVDPADARRRVWCLTPAGEALRPQLAAAMKAHWPG